MNAAPRARRPALRLFAFVLSAAFGAPGTHPGLAAQPACTSESPVRLDHVIVAVRSLEEASATYEGLGFTLEEGRLHESGLLNRHAKFRDGTEIELMSLAGPPTDEIARGYAAFLSETEGGAFLALRGRIDRVGPRAERAGLTPRLLEVGAFRYLTFAEPELAAVFVIDDVGRADEPPAITTHANGALGLVAATVEGGESLGTLLAALGGTACDDGSSGRRWAFGGGGTVTVAEAPRVGRPRVLAAGLRTTADDRDVPPERAGGIRISFSGRDRGPVRRVPGR